MMDSKLYELDTRLEALRLQMSQFPENILKDYRDRLDVSWIYHDHALEGVVLSYSELKAAIDHRIISDVSLIPMYEDVKNHKLAVDTIREACDGRRGADVNLDLVRKFYALLSADPNEKGSSYRKENPLHRLYYHEISAPEKIPLRMKKFGEWLVSPPARELHPVTRAARAQQQLLAIYPWTKNSGKVARLLTNYILIRHGYPPAIVHSIERQRYYDSLRHEGDALLQLIVESLKNSIDTSFRFFEELKGLAGRRAAS